MSSGGVAKGLPQVVRVNRELLAACMTCPLCHKLLRDATTISECLHTLEKLRPDHTLQDVRVKIFPYKRRKINAPEVLPSITLPVRRKERSLSSLVVNTPRIGTQACLTGRRTKAVARRASVLRGLSPVIDEPVKKDADNSEHFSENSSSPETLNKMPHSRRQKLLTGQKGIKASPQGPDIKVEQENGLSGETCVHKTKVQDHPSKSKFQDDESKGIPSCPVAVKSRKVHGMLRKRKEVGHSAQAIVDASDVASGRRFSPIWLSLVSSVDQKGDKQLPQISTSYIRIKEGNIPVTFLQKYLVQKLNLASEAEVEISCRGLHPAASHCTELPGARQPQILFWRCSKLAICCIEGLRSIFAMPTASVGGATEEISGRRLLVPMGTATASEVTSDGLLEKGMLFDDMSDIGENMGLRPDPDFLLFLLPHQVLRHQNALQKNHYLIDPDHPNSSQRAKLVLQLSGYLHYKL
ncbi:hypothetical protein HPP92_010034 [Vanilla planifolia]|uniref:Uncharacterized protein n=1 Tax=Vanilla planifolia TaxID=51239 RepID=A0A835R5N3_VANPL|nr:hypothetical protein HPP92_010034 [Vanilla planifolia]